MLKKTIVAVTLLLGAARANAQVVWALGDSITRLYASALATQHPEWTVVNYGQDGETARDAIDRLQAIVASAPPRPDVIVIGYGTNDVVRYVIEGDPGFDPTDTVTRIGTLASIATTTGATVVVALPPGLAVHAQRDVGQDAGARALFLLFRNGINAIRRGLRQFPLRTDLRVTGVRYFADLVHYNELGSAKAAARVARTVQRVLTRQTLAARSS